MPGLHNKQFTIILFVGCLCFGALSCNDDDHLGSFKDPRDNKSYKTLLADGQLWFAEDLKFEDSTLYSYQQGLSACPSGWSLPSKADWISLNNYFGGYIENGEKIGNPTAAYNRMLSEFGVEEENYYWTSSPAWDDAASIRSSAFRFSSYFNAVEYTSTLINFRMLCRCIKKETPEGTGDIIEFKANGQKKVFDFYRINYPQVSGEVNLFLHAKLVTPGLLDRTGFYLTLPTESVSAQDQPVQALDAAIGYQFSNVPGWSWDMQSASTTEDLEVLITFYNGSIVKGTFSGTTYDDVAITDGAFELAIN